MTSYDELKINLLNAIGDDIIAGCEAKLRDAVANQLSESLAECGYLQTCMNCTKFTEATELCSLANSRPPARVIAFGCPMFQSSDETAQKAFVAAAPSLDSTAQRYATAPIAAPIAQPRANLNFTAKPKPAPASVPGSTYSVPKTATGFANWDDDIPF